MRQIKIKITVTKQGFNEHTIVGRFYPQILLQNGVVSTIFAFVDDSFPTRKTFSDKFQTAKINKI